MKLPAAETPSVGIREFRATLAEYIDANTPVTVTRHGQVVGLFVPLRRPSAEAVQRVREASARVQEVMPLSAEEIEQMVADFDALRRSRSMPSADAKAKAE
jgi:antitoxin (DNA-binding transcriptional repressor) of toxin-antitoxin stability system